MLRLQGVFAITLLAFVPLSLANSPIILVPGFTGSRLEATLNKKSSKYPWCMLKSEKYTIWRNPAKWNPLEISCFVENLKMTYDNVTKTTSNAEGVTITVPGFGDTRTIESITPSDIPGGKYFDELVEYFVSKNYERNKSIRGAPYDFRKAPIEQDEYFKKLKDLVEDTYLLNYKKKVLLIGHSMGCDMLIEFLSRQKSSWKTKYVKALVTLAGPFAGAVSDIIPIISGTSFGTKDIPSLKTRPLVRSFSAVTSFLPNPQLWKSDAVLVETPCRNYSVKDYKTLTKDLNWKNGYDMYKDSQGVMNNRTFPNVEMHCVYGLGKNTPESIKYDKSFPDGKPVAVTFGDGDGTVNRLSLESCKTMWGSKDKFSTMVFHNTSHGEIIGKEEVFKYILNVARG